MYIIDKKTCDITTIHYVFNKPPTNTSDPINNVNYVKIINNIFMHESQNALNIFSSSPFRDDNDDDFNKKYHFIAIRKPSTGLIRDWIHKNYFDLFKQLNYDELFVNILKDGQELNINNKLYDTFTLNKK